MLQLILSVISKGRTRKRKELLERSSVHAVSPDNPHPHPAGFNLKMQVQLEVLRLGLGLDVQEL